MKKRTIKTKNVENDRLREIAIETFRINLYTNFINLELRKRKAQKIDNNSLIKYF